MTKEEILFKIDRAIHELRNSWHDQGSKIVAEAFEAIRDYIDKNDTEPAKVKSTVGNAPKDWGELWSYITGDLGMTLDDARYLWNNWKANGFTRNGKAIKDWRAAARAWKAGKFYPSQKQK